MLAVCLWFVLLLLVCWLLFGWWFVFVVCWFLLMLFLAVVGVGLCLFVGCLFVGFTSGCLLAVRFCCAVCFLFFVALGFVCDLLCLFA